jgi:hypothetical protein
MPRLTWRPGTPRTQLSVPALRNRTVYCAVAPGASVGHGSCETQALWKPGIAADADCGTARAATAMAIAVTRAPSASRRLAFTRE